MSRACPHGLCLRHAGHDGRCVEGHDPSWTPRERRGFCASLTAMGLRYGELARELEVGGGLRPSWMSTVERAELLISLARQRRAA